MGVIKRVVLSLFFGAKIFASSWDLLENDEDSDTSSIVSSAENLAQTSEEEVYKIQHHFVIEKNQHHPLNYDFVVMSVLPYIGSKRDLRAFIAAFSGAFYHSPNRELYREEMAKALLGHDALNASHHRIFRAMRSFDYIPLSFVRREEFFKRFPVKIEESVEDLDDFVASSARGRGRLLEEVMPMLNLHGARKVLLQLMRSTHISQVEKLQWITKHHLNLDLIRFLGIPYLRSNIPSEFRDSFQRRYQALSYLQEMTPLERKNFLASLPEEDTDDHYLKIVLYLALAKDVHVSKNGRLEAVRFLFEHYKGQFDDQIIEAYQSIVTSQKIPERYRFKTAKELFKNYPNQYQKQISKLFSSFVGDASVYDDLRFKAAKFLYNFLRKRDKNAIIDAYLSIARDQGVLVDKRLKSLKFLLKHYRERVDYHAQEMCLSFVESQKYSINCRLKALEMMMQYFHPVYKFQIQKACSSFVRNKKLSTDQQNKAQKLLRQLKAVYPEIV